MRLKAALFPYDGLDIEAGLNRLTKVGLITRYQTAGGISVIAIPTWSKHQQPHIREAVSELPANDASTVLALFEPVGSGKGREQEQEGVQVVGLQRKSPVRGLQSSGAILDRFEMFWAEYPRKTAKDSARKEFLQIAPDEAFTDRMIEAVRRARASEQWRKDSGQFIPHGRTWLHQKRWEDEAAVRVSEPVARQQVAGCDHVTPCTSPQECYQRLRDPKSYPRKAAAS